MEAGRKSRGLGFGLPSGGMARSRQRAREWRTRGKQSRRLPVPASNSISSERIQPVPNRPEYAGFYLK